MNRLLVALAGVAGLAMAGCDGSSLGASPSDPTPPPVAEKPSETKPAASASQTVDFATAVVTSKSAKLVDDAAGGKLLITDPAAGGYTLIVPLPVVPAGMKVRLEIEVKKGAVGAVITEAVDANAWSTPEVVANVGAVPPQIELDAKTLEPAKTLLLRNASPEGASEAILKSLTVTPP